MFKSMEKRASWGIAIVFMIVAVVLLIPFVYVSKFAYPWADDFNYAGSTHQVFLKTHSLIATIVEAFRSMMDTYFSWQGTYTSCFLMALQPAVWNIKLYHLTGVIMLGTMLFAYGLLANILLKKVLGMPGPIVVIITTLVYVYSVECTRGIAEGFTWFNSAVHYTFNNAWSWGYVALLILHLYNCCKKQEHRTGSKVGLCILALLVAGGNNVTVLCGIIFNVLLTIAFFIYQKFLKKGISKVDLGLEALPMLAAYLIGGMLNYLSPGNSVRMSSMGGKGNPILTIIRAFQVGFLYIGRRFSWELAAVLILIAVAVWYSFNREKSIDGISFSFPLPGVVIALSFCLLCALATPLIYTGDATEELKYVFIQVYEVYRTENVIFFDFVLFLVFDIVYLQGWIYKKGFKVTSIPVMGGVSMVAIVMLVIVVRGNLINATARYVTSEAVSNIQNSTASYYGYQMAENTYRLTQEDRDVYVMPIAVAPGCLYPFEAEDWITGTKIFYDKDSVTYESEPYIFNR